MGTTVILLYWRNGLKTTCDVYGAYASVFQVNKLQTVADPFQPARASDNGAQNDVEKQRLKGAGKMNLDPKRGKHQMP